MSVDTYLSVNQACRQFGFSRSTFYRMLHDPKLDLEDVVVRIPPVTGRIKIPAQRFEEWLRENDRGGDEE